MTTTTQTQTQQTLKPTFFDFMLITTPHGVELSMGEKEISKGTEMIVYEEFGRMENEKLIPKHPSKYELAMVCCELVRRLDTPNNAYIMKKYTFGC